MKITIDTKDDSKEEISKAIRLLQSIIEASEIAGQGELPVTGENVMSLFDSLPEVAAETPKTKSQEKTITEDDEAEEDEEEFSGQLETY